MANPKPNRDHQGKSSGRRYRGKMQHLLRQGLDRVAAMRRARAYAGGKTSPRAGLALAEVYRFDTQPQPTYQTMAPLTLGEVGQPIQIAKVGTFKHPSHGTFSITPGDCAVMAGNFKAGARGIELAVDENHDPDHKAVGWFKDVEARTDGLWATVEWTDRGADLLKSGTYRYFSPEFAPNYVDAEKGTEHGPTLLGGALTNRPFLKGMEPVALSETVALDDPTSSDVHVDTAMQPPKRKRKKGKAVSMAETIKRSFAPIVAAEGDAADMGEDAAEEDCHEAMLTWLRQALIDAMAGYDPQQGMARCLSALNTYLDADDAEDDAESGEPDGAAALPEVAMAEPTRVTPGRAGVGGHVLVTTINGEVQPPTPNLAGQLTAPTTGVVQAAEPPTLPAPPAGGNQMSTPTATPAAPAANDEAVQIALKEVADVRQELALKEQAMADREKTLKLREDEARKTELTATFQRLCDPDAQGIVRVTPGQKDAALAMVLKLNEVSPDLADAQLALLAANIGVKTGEVGYGTNQEQGGKAGNAVERLNARVTAYLAENKGLTYTQALDAVTLAEPQLAQDYHAEQAARHR